MLAAALLIAMYPDVVVARWTSIPKPWQGSRRRYEKVDADAKVRDKAESSVSIR